MADPRDLPGDPVSATTTQPQPSVRRVGEPPADPTRRPRRTIASPAAWLGWLVAAVAIAAAVYFATQAARLQSAEASRVQAQEAAEIVALQITTFDGEDIDEWIRQTQTLATGTFADDLASRYDQQLRDALRDSGVRSVGEVLNSFVQDADAASATVFVIVRQTSSYPSSEQTVEDELRMELTLTREQGRWLASDVAVLSPTPPLSTAPEAAQPQEETS